MFSWLIRWAGSDFGSATKAIFTSVSIRNSTLSIKSLQKRILLSFPIQFCFCGWPDLLAQFLLLATVQLERTWGWLESSHEVTLCELSHPQKNISGGYVRILTTFLWKICAKGLPVHAQISTLAHRRCTGGHRIWHRYSMKGMCIKPSHPDCTAQRCRLLGDPRKKYITVCCSCWHPM